jgi:type I restriction enzyme S subunit
VTRWPCWHNLAKAKGPGIVTGRYGTIGVFYLIDTDYWPLNTSLYSIDLHGNVPHYLCYMLHSLADLFLLNSAKSAVPGVDRNDLHAITVAVPPVQEQNEIAAILDRETAKIDALVAKEQRLIELLQEQRAALISHAVTKGLNGLGDSAKRYTEMWTETRLGRAIKLQRGFDITGAADGMGDIPVISSGGFSGQCSIPIVRGPGVIVGRKGTLGTVHFCEGDFWPHDTTLWVREFGGNHPRFVYYFLLHMRLESYDVGAANPTLNRNHVHPLIVRWPDVESQRRIAEYLDRASGTVDPLIAKVNETISRLREYRTALISAAVTGKIDVRGEAE